MPQVPRIQPQSVEQRPISAPQAPTQAPLEQFGGGQSAAGVLEAGGQLSRTVSLIYQEEKKKADQVAVLGADQELSRWETERLYKAETGAMNKKGKDAFGLPDEVNKDFTKIVGDITSKLNNDDQRLAFQRMATSRGVDIERSLTKHVSAEMRSYDDTITESYLKTEREAAVANFSDNERVDIGIERQKGAIVDYANRYGLPQEYVKLKTQEAVSKTRTDVVSRYLAVGDDLKAKAYYDQHKDEFSGADQMHMDKALEEGSLRGESQRINDKIMSTAKTRSEAMQMVKELSGSNPKLREVAENLTTS